MSEPPPPLVHARGLSCSYGERIGIEGVDLELGERTVLGFLGPNGAGKTTTIRVLLGFLRQASGTARVLGRDPWREAHLVKREVGYLPGDLRLYPWLTAESALVLAGRMRGKELLGPGLELAERFDLERGVRVREMSRGTRQKLGLVLALAHRPRLLVLDEPTSGLDPLMQDELARTLRAFAAGGGAVFLSSHGLAEVESLCERVVILRRGRIVADEPLVALRARAPRVVEVRFRSAELAAHATPPPALRHLESDGPTWTGELAGAWDEALAWLAAQPIDDLVVRPPDLERLFLGFYRDEER